MFNIGKLKRYNIICESSPIERKTSIAMQNVIVYRQLAPEL